MQRSRLGKIHRQGDDPANKMAGAAYSYGVKRGRYVSLDAPDCMDEEQRLAALFKLAVEAIEAEETEDRAIELENNHRIELALEVMDQLPETCRYIRFVDK